MIDSKSQLPITKYQHMTLMGGEAYKSRNRIYKYVREHHVRKINRETCLTFSFELCILQTPLLVQSH